MRFRSTFLTFAFLSFILLTACSSGRMSTRMASQKLKPVEALPQREQLMMPENFSVQINNVADAVSSYGNYVKLFINGKEIAPERSENNLKSQYTYNLRLQPGVYDVRAEYHVIGFWKKRVYDITTDEAVKVLPGQKTELTVALKKDSRGFLKEKKSQFSLRYAAIDNIPDAPTRTFRPAVVVSKPAEVIVDKVPAVERAPVARAPRLRQPVSPALPASGLKLQINTVPVGADVYVDDRFVGQSPVRVTISRFDGHVIQIANRGYEEYLKVLDAADLSSRKEMNLVVRLQKVE